MRLSVRLRLTLVVATVAASLASVAAFVAPSVVEQALIDDAVEAELAEFDNFFEPTFSGFPDDFPEEILDFDPNDFDLQELFFIDRDEMAFIVELLDGSGNYQRLLDLSGTDDLLVTSGGGEYVRVNADRSIDPFFADFTDIDQPVVEFFSLAEFAFGSEGELFAFPDDELAELTDSADTIIRRTSLDGRDVIVIASASAIDSTVSRVRGVLWTALPLVVLVSGLVAWLLAGRALKPVRDITERTAAIRGGTLDERVPVPGGGDEISTLATTMNGMLDRLETDDRRRRRFVSDASHELRSPVAVIKSEAEVALRTPESTTVTELANGVLDESTRMATIIDDLLALARHDEGMPPPQTSIDLDDIVLTESARSRRVPIDATAVSGGRVVGRPDEFARVVAHLLDNAARHAESTVKIALSTANGRVTLGVDDDGPGVAPEDRVAIFERFARLDDARTRDRGGAGLGLAVVAGVVERSGGTVQVTDSGVGGARFVIDLPAAD